MRRAFPGTATADARTPWDLAPSPCTTLWSCGQHSNTQHSSTQQSSTQHTEHSADPELSIEQLRGALKPPEPTPQGWEDSTLHPTPVHPLIPSCYLRFRRRCSDARSVTTVFSFALERAHGMPRAAPAGHGPLGSFLLCSPSSEKPGRCQAQGMPGWGLQPRPQSLLLARGPSLKRRLTVVPLSVPPLLLQPGLSPGP